MVMAKATVTLYTRPGCHLCEEAKAAMRASGCKDEFLLEEINIDRDAALHDKYKFDIPVVYENNRRAILAVEKGMPGERAFAEAFAAWRQ